MQSFPEFKKGQIPQAKNLSQGIILVLVVLLLSFMLLGISEEILWYLQQQGWDNYESEYNFVSPGIKNERGGFIAIHSIAFDAEENLWVGTYDSAYMISKDGSFRRYTGERLSFPEGQVSALVTDNQDQIWAGTSNGLARLIKAKFLWHWEVAFEDQVFDIKVGPEGALWIASREALSVIQKNGEITQYPYNDLQPLSGLAFDNQGQLWATTGYSTYKILPDMSREDQEYPSFGYSHSFEIDSRNRILIGTSDGLAICQAGRCTLYDAKNSALFRVRHSGSSDVYSIEILDGGDVLLGVRNNMRIVELDKLPAPWLVNLLMGFRWFENIAVYVLVYLLVKRLLREKNYALLGFAGGVIPFVIYIFASGATMKGITDMQIPVVILFVSVLGSIGWLTAKLVGKRLGWPAAYFIAGVVVVSAFIVFLIFTLPQ